MGYTARGGVVVLLTAAIACGCGDGDQQPVVRDVMHRYLGAIADGHGQKACATMTATGRRDVVRMLNGLIPKLHSFSCQQALTGLYKELNHGQVVQLRRAEIEVDLDGDTATARPKEGTSSAKLRNVDGRWLIDRVQF